MRKILTTSFILCGMIALSGQSPSSSPSSSRCHVFVDDQNIWTLEVVEDANGTIVPILNVITLSRGKWEFRPSQIHIYNQQGKEARAEKFSMDTGVPGEPYIMEFLNVLGKSFIGLELIGQFSEFENPSRVAIDLADFRYTLEPIDCMDFNMLAEKINGINIDSPNIWEDFEVLKIDFRGRKDPLR